MKANEKHCPVFDYILLQGTSIHFMPAMAYFSCLIYVGFLACFSYVPYTSPCYLIIYLTILWLSVSRHVVSFLYLYKFLYILIILMAFILLLLKFSFPLIFFYFTDVSIQHSNQIL